MLFPVGSPITHIELFSRFELMESDYISLGSVLIQADSDISFHTKRWSVDVPCLTAVILCVNVDSLTQHQPVPALCSSLSIDFLTSILKQLVALFDSLIQEQPLTSLGDARPLDHKFVCWGVDSSLVDSGNDIWSDLLQLLL